MEDKTWKFTIRVDKLLFRKFQYIADYNGRSANREIEHCLKRIVAAFEREHGEISVENDDQ